MTNWKQQADQLLAKSKILDVLKKYGQPEFTGSYLYDLMTTGDIDLYLITKDDTHTVAKNLLQDLVETGWWNGYMLYDWVHWHRDYMLDSYYVGTKIDFADSRWKVDIWVLNEFPAEQKAYNAKLAAQLTPENRQQILAIKQSRDKNRWEVDGKTIYNAVLEHNITTPESFQRKYIK